MDWTKQFPAAITISDLSSTIIYMNDKAASVFAGDGGYNLIGKSLFDCHSRAANDKINEIINSKNSNAYTIEKTELINLSIRPFTMRMTKYAA